LYRTWPIVTYRSDNKNIDRDQVIEKIRDCG